MSRCTRTAASVLGVTWCHVIIHAIISLVAEPWTLVHTLAAAGAAAACSTLHRLCSFAGGRDQFNWENVRADKEREYYLGHSVKVRGRWSGCCVSLLSRLPTALRSATPPPLAHPHARVPL